MASTISKLRIVVTGPDSIDVYVTSDSVESYIVATALTFGGDIDPWLTASGLDEESNLAPNAAAFETTPGETYLGSIQDLNFAGGQSYFIRAIAVRYSDVEGEEATLSNQLGPLEIRRVTDLVWIQLKDPSGNRRTYSKLVDRSLIGAAAARASAQGGLTAVPLGLSGNAHALSVALGAFTAAIRLAGTPHAQSAAAATLNAAIQFAAGQQERVWVQLKDSAGNRNTYSKIVTRIGVRALSAATGALSVTPGLGGTALDVAHATGGLVSWATVTLAAPLYTGPGSILDSRYWYGNAPAVGDRVAYDPTYLTILPSGEIESTSNNFTALVQYNDGTGWQLGSVTVLPTAMVGFAGAQAGASGSLGGNAIALGGQAHSVATAAASVVAGILFQGSAAARVQAQAALTTLINLVGAASAQVGATGTLGGGGGSAQLAGVAVTTSSSTASLTGQIALVGAAVALAAAVAGLATGQGLVGQAQDAARATGALDALVQLAGAAQAQSEGRGLFGVGELLFGEARSQAHAEASLDALVALRAEATVAAQAAGTMDAQIQMLGGATGISSAAAGMTALGPVVRAPRGHADPRLSQRRSNRW